ncbi:MAG TPA: alcohol dehydrogenase catalytic domain-containing protein [Firmicutes bacterium]|nr:hypothetical protein [Bacillota bacterium]HHV58215.1 alcohol dehydrogenase catalytic domain-containing protein [Bacillota bacterium]
MRAARYWGKEDIRVEDVPVPEIGPGEALIKVGYAGICGSDMWIYSGTHPRAKAPLIMSHEFAGEIAALSGEDNRGFKVGDHVTVNPLLYCGRCLPCRSGRHHVCKKLGLSGIDADGGFAEYVKVGINQLVKLPPDLPLDTAALTEPTAVTVHAVHRGGVKVGDQVVVLGGGPIGYLVAVSARAAGAAQVIVSEPSDLRRNLAARHGFTVVDGGPGTKDAVLTLTGGDGADVVFDAAGVPATAALATEIVRVSGRVVVVGVFKHPAPVDLLAVNFNELEIVGTRVYTDQAFEAAARLVASSPDVAAVISHRLPLSEAPQAMRVAREAKDAMKILIHP